MLLKKSATRRQKAPAFLLCYAPVGRIFCRRAPASLAFFCGFFYPTGKKSCSIFFFGLIVTQKGFFKRRGPSAPVRETIKPKKNAAALPEGLLQEEGPFCKKCRKKMLAARRAFFEQLFLCSIFYFFFLWLLPRSATQPCVALKKSLKRRAAQPFF
jgi:hypothetical protein